LIIGVFITVIAKYTADFKSMVIITILLKAAVLSAGMLGLWDLASVAL